MKGHNFRDALITAPVACRALFYFSRPKSVPKSAIYKRTAPDADKLCRAVGDSLEGVALKNDSVIVVWHAAKLYTDGASRVEIELWELDAADTALMQRGSAPGLALFAETARTM
jgi:Holliday junction resolvase RusA-like endonuclease